MSTIFTRARAAKAVIALIQQECGVSNSKIRCDAQLERDLGIAGDDTYCLLEAMSNEGVDLSEFDCHDFIAPEGAPVLPCILWILLLTLSSYLCLCLLSISSAWLAISIAIVTASTGTYVLSRRLSPPRKGDLRVRDLIVSYEARRWISPKAEQGAAANP